MISHTVEAPAPVDGDAMLRQIELAGRTCYKSEERATAESSRKFVAMLIKRGHHSVLEHVWMRVRFVLPRGISHELVRHRLASYSQESSRYCDYGGGVAFIRPRWLERDSADEYAWRSHMKACEIAYTSARERGWKPQQARGLLPIDLKTEVVMSANARQWRHFFTMRAAKPAHPQMRESACALLREMRGKVPILFDDVGDTGADATDL